MLDEYQETIKRLNEAELEYLNIHRKYADEEFKILTSFNFKQEYGKDNDKIRNGHIKMELNDLLLQKDALELEINQLKRHIKYLELALEYG